MTLDYKRLSSGYHYVKANSFHHLFAQWPVGERLTPSHVSSHGELNPITFASFMWQAEQLAASASGDASASK